MGQQSRCAEQAYARGGKSRAFRGEASGGGDMDPGRVARGGQILCGGRRARKQQKNPSPLLVAHNGICLLTYTDAALSEGQRAKNGGDDARGPHGVKR